MVIFLATILFDAYDLSNIKILSRLIDGRKTGITLEQTDTVINRASGKYGGTLPGKVEIWTNEGIIRR